MDNISELRLYVVDGKDKLDEGGAESFDPVLLEMGVLHTSGLTAFDHLNPQKPASRYIIETLQQYTRIIFTDRPVDKDIKGLLYVDDLYQRVLTGKLHDCIVILSYVEEVARAHKYAKAHPELNLVVMNGASFYYEGDKMCFEVLCERAGVMQRPKTEFVLPKHATQEQLQQFPFEDVLIKPVAGSLGLGALVCKRDALLPILQWTENPKSMPSFPTSERFLKYWREYDTGIGTPIAVQELVRAKPISLQGKSYEATFRHVVMEIHFKDGREPVIETLAAFYKCARDPLVKNMQPTSENIISVTKEELIRTRLVPMSDKKRTQQATVLKPILLKLSRAMFTTTLQSLWAEPLLTVPLQDAAAQVLQLDKQFNALYYFMTFLAGADNQKLSQDIIDRISIPAFHVLYPQSMMAVLRVHYFGTANYRRYYHGQTCSYAFNPQDRDLRLFPLIKQLITDPKSTLGFAILTDCITAFKNKIIPQNEFKEFITLLEKRFASHKDAEIQALLSRAKKMIPPPTPKAASKLQGGFFNRAKKTKPPTKKPPNGSLESRK